MLLLTPAILLFNGNWMCFLQREKKNDIKKKQRGEDNIRRWSGEEELCPLSSSTIQILARH